MINRRQIRIKVMQTLFACENEAEVSPETSQAFYNKSTSDFYELYYNILSLLCKIHQNATERFDYHKNKKHAAGKHLHANPKFINNRIFEILTQNETLRTIIDKNKYWEQNEKYIDIIFNEIAKSSLYVEYLENPKNDYQTDKNFFISLFAEIIAPHDLLYSFYEDTNLTWIDDLPLINTFFIKIINKLPKNATDKAILPDLESDKEDVLFGKLLLLNTIGNHQELEAEIQKKSINWDTQRLAAIDRVLLKMAICELQHFDSIPVKVTINEYVEIAKFYSTPNSSHFINGILDKISKNYKENNLFPKSGRGLQ